MENRNSHFSVTGDNTHTLFIKVTEGNTYTLSNESMTDNLDSKQSFQWNRSTVRQISENYLNSFSRFSDNSLHQKLTLEQKNEYKKTLKGLLEIAGERNWDGENADPVTPETVEAALKVIEELPSAVDAPEIAADPEGNIEFDWHLDNGTMFTISVGPIGDVAISGLYLGKAKLTGMEEDSKDTPLNLLRCGLEWLIKMHKI